jgi:hypothetical protein
MDKAALANEVMHRARRMSELQITLGETADNSELLRALARILRGVPIERAFGAPGDWGYNHQVGKALAAKGND